jgi:hypothetical protein
MLAADLGGSLELKAGARVELIVADAPLARALFDGVPAARLLARVRLACDARDANSTAGRDGKSSSWDALMARLLGSTPEVKQRVKRAVARHTRVADDEGPLYALETTIVPLVLAVASSDGDASLSELYPTGGSRAVEPLVAQACAVFDQRLAQAGDLRAPMLEACVRLAGKTSIGPFAWERLRDAAAKLSGPELAMTLLRPSKGSLFPGHAEATAHAPRMAQLDRAELDALVRKDPRELAAKIARVDASRSRPRDQLDTLVADLSWLLSHEGTLVLAVVPFEPSPDDAIPASRATAPSWTPHDWSSPDAAGRLADALEKGATTVPRVRAVVMGGGEPAYDAIGAEMLHAASHPFASAAFADILSSSSRPRDVIRLVTYFAVAPDPANAARALGRCAAPELPRVLGAWLESMLPGDMGSSDDDDEPESAARVSACVASLAPYPHLYRAVLPLLGRVSDSPPASA